MTSSTHVRRSPPNHDDEFDDDVVFAQRAFELSLANQQELLALQLASSALNPASTPCSDRQIRQAAMHLLQHQQQQLSPSSSPPATPSSSSPSKPLPHWYSSSATAPSASSPHHAKFRLVASVTNKTVCVFFSSRLLSASSASSSSASSSAPPPPPSLTVSRYSFSFLTREQADRFLYRTILRQDNLFRFFVSPAFHSAPFAVSSSLLDTQKLKFLLHKVVPKQTKRATAACVVIQRALRRRSSRGQAAPVSIALPPPPPPILPPATKWRRRRRRRHQQPQPPQQRRLTASACAASITAIQRAVRGWLLRRRLAWLVLAVPVHQVRVLQRAVRELLRRKQAARVLGRFLLSRCAPRVRTRLADAHYVQQVLSAQIADWYAHNTRKFEEEHRPHYAQVLEGLRRILWRENPYTTTCEAFGSTTTPGLALPSSDLDVVIHHCSLSPHELFEVLKRHTEFASHVQLVRAGGGVASGPLYVIKLQTVHGVHVDVSFWNSKQHMGNSHSQFVQALLGQFPGVLAPLVVVLKQYLRINHLNTAFTGGLSSIAIVLMVWVYVRDRLQQDNSSSSLGQLLLGLLDLYGQQGFFARYGVCAKRGIYELPPSLPLGGAGPPVAAAYIHDPLREGNNLSFGMYRASQVSAQLARFAAVLRRYQRLHRGGGLGSGNALVDELLL